MDGVKGRG
jgi:transitional endoplasmic reticulum ATPase